MAEKKFDQKLVAAKAEEFEFDKEKLDKELKRLSSAKCNLAKQKFRKDYDSKMSEILEKFELTRQAKSLVVPKKKFVTDFTEEDIAKLDFDETMKAIKSIQSKIFHTKYETPDPETHQPYIKAKQIESWLLEHKKNVKPVEDAYIRRTDLQTVIDTIETARIDITVEQILSLLKNL